MPEEIEKTGEKLAVRRSLFAGKKVGIAAKVEAAKATFDPSKMENRIGIIFDDSGSMGSSTQVYNHNDSHQVRTSKLSDAKDGLKEFFKACDLSKTACSLYGFNPERRYHLSTDIVALSLLPDFFEADQGTPLFSTSRKMVDSEPINRMIIFSDGESTDSYQDSENSLIERCIEKVIPVDTVFIGNSQNGEATLKRIAERTGGIFMKFSDSANFRKSFKYLAPAFRGYLEDKSFRQSIGSDEK